MSRASDNGASDSRTAGRAVDPLSTLELLNRARGGDQHAFAQLLERHGRALRRWASGRLPLWARDVSDTDDLVQDTIVHTFRRLDTFEARGPGALQAYLRQALLNRIRDELRRHGRRPGRRELTEEEAFDGHSPLEIAIGHAAVERYDQALAALRPEEREAIIGRVEMGYTYEELAEVLGKPSPEAARKAAERALIRLAERMGHDRR